MVAPMRQLLRVLSPRENSGVAAVEFAIFSILLLTIFAGTVDIGRSLFTVFELDNALGAATQYTVNNAAMVGTNASGLGTNITNIVNNLNGTGWATSTIDVNNNNDGSYCYCPTGTSGHWSWGSSVTCGNSCTGSGIAGQFVAITARRGITPLFPAFGFVANGQISRSILVETQ
jgi:Flp pilus assembly protein TadG